MIDKLSVLLLTFIPLWIFLIIYNGEIQYYIHPRYNLLTLTFAIAGFVLSIACLFLWNKTHLHDLVSKTNKLIYLFFIIIIISAMILIKPSPLSIEIVSSRGYKNEYLLNDNNKKINSSPFLSYDTEDFELGEWMNQLYENKNDTVFVGKSVNVSGFIYHEKTENEFNEFLIARNVITCCAVDASPVGIIARSEYSISPREIGKWYKLKGEFVQGENGLMINVIEMQPTNVPKDPYLY